MKQLHFLQIAVLTVATPILLHAQDFVNGSFEQNSGLCMINASTTVFNANVKNTKAFGSFRKPDIASADCGFGNAKDGNWFVGLATNIQGGIRSEAITMQLSQPVVDGGQYSLSFFARSRSFASNLELGVSTVDSSAGELFYTVSANSIGSDWTEITVRFTAPQSGSYVSIRAVNPNSNSGVWLDAFHLKQVFQPDNVVMTSSKPTEPSKPTVAAPHKADIVALYPNPSEGYVKVNTDSSQVVSLTVYNMLGAQVEQHIATADQPVPDHIDLTEQQPGLYFVEVGTVSGEKVTKRIIVSR